MCSWGHAGARGCSSEQAVTGEFRRRLAHARRSRRRAVRFAPTAVVENRMMGVWEPWGGIAS